MFQGSIVALITPFKNGGVDEAAFRSFVEWQINEGTEGLAWTTPSRAPRECAVPSDEK